MSRRPILAAMIAVPLALLPALGRATEASDRDALGNEAIELMIENSGPGQAEALLGVLYLRGMRSEPDPVAATAWLERAARAGHPSGIYAAARMYAEGIGVPVDVGRARELLRDQDPARFGAMTDAVRQLRLSLDLPPAPDPAPSPAPAPATTTPAEPPPPAPKPEVAAVAPVPPPPPSPVQAPPASPPQAPVSVEEANRPKPEAPIGPFAQLATLFSEGSTVGEIARFRAMIPPDLLDGRSLVIRTTRLSDGRAAWRVMVIGFVDVGEARSFCSTVRQSGVDCVPKG